MGNEFAKGFQDSMDDAEKNSSGVEQESPRPALDECDDCGHKARFSDNEGGICEAIIERMDAADFFTNPPRQPVRCGCRCAFFVWATQSRQENSNDH